MSDSEGRRDKDERKQKRAELKGAPGITLSYTFFPLDEPAAPVATRKGDETEAPTTDQL